MPVERTYLPTYLPTYLVITARLPVLWMEFAKCRSFLPPEVSARNFGEAGLGNLKFVVGQKNGAQWTLTMGVHHAPFAQKWICRMVT